MKIKLAKTEIIHFIGIGGIGMSGLAIIMKNMGFKVQGSDISLNKNIERLKKNQIKVSIGHKKNNILNSTIIVYSSAIKMSNPEILEAKRKKLPIYKRGKMLGEIVSLMKNIVVAGSHGKTTTTSLISSIFLSSSIDCTTINGGVLNSFKDTVKLGKGEWCILESDESDGSFLEIPITYSIVTNIDKEHLDHYKSFKNLKENFINFIEKTPSFGKCFICTDDKINREILKKIKNNNYLTYGISENSNFKITNIFQNKNVSEFDLQINLPGKINEKIKKIQIPMIGEHNIKNATAAIAVAYSIGISIRLIKKGLKNFEGVQRRFNHIFEYRNTQFIDDYAHHPTEISAVLDGIKQVYTNEEIVCIFQPHRVSRLNLLRYEFSKCFNKADTLLLCPIFKAGETINLNFKYEKFAAEIIKRSNVKLILINDQIQLSRFIKQNIFGKKIVVGMGAGSISKWIRDLQNKL